MYSVLLFYNKFILIIKSYIHNPFNIYYTLLLNNQFKKYSLNL